MNKPNGQVKCPACRKDFDYKLACPAFSEELNAIYILYALCPNCNSKFTNGNDSSIKQIENTCFLNFKTLGLDATGNLYAWSVTDEITLHTNNYKLQSALIHGHNIPRPVYELFEKGMVILDLLPTELYGQPPNNLELEFNE